MQLPLCSIQLSNACTFIVLREQTWLIQRHASEEVSELYIPGVQRFVAWCLFSHFVTSPFFGADISKIPARCQVLLWEDAEGYGVLIPLLDGDHRTELGGCEAGLRLKSECGPLGKTSANLSLALLHRAKDPYAALREGMAAAVRWMNRGRLREEKGTPRWLNLLGWCTWDAFYAEVDEEKILQGLRAFRQAGVVPGFVIIDEGWQDYDQKHFLLSLGVKAGAFTNDRLETIVHTAKTEFGVKMMGCWRTLFGELRGVSADALGLTEFRRELVLETGTEHDFFGVIAPKDVAKFHEAYSARMAADGGDFVKVDFQSALHLMTHSQIGRVAGARLWQETLQEAVERHFHGEMLNCMAMGSDEVFHTSLSNVARASDDFFPTKDHSHPAHIRQNAYNALWLSQLQWPDWDMFQSKHPWAEYHAIGRAISGGPVYVTDKPGESDCALLSRFLATDGSVLRCPQPGLPCRDLLFDDPTETVRFMKVFNRCGENGLLAVFHPGSEGKPIIEEVCVADVEGFSSERSAVFSVMQGFLGMFSKAEKLCLELDVRGADLLVFSPLREGSAVLGLIDKWNPPAGILRISHESTRMEIESLGGGRFGLVSHREIRDIVVNGESVRWSSEEGFVWFLLPEERNCGIVVEFAGNL